MKTSLLFFALCIIRCQCLQSPTDVIKELKREAFFKSSRNCAVANIVTCCLKMRRMERTAGLVSDTLRIRGGGRPPLFPGGISPDYGFGSFQLPQFGSGPTLYIPIVAIAFLAWYGQFSAQLHAGVRGWSKLTRERLKYTYAYFAASILAWFGSALLFWKFGIIVWSPWQLLADLALSIFLIYKVSDQIFHFAEFLRPSNSPRRPPLSISPFLLIVRLPVCVYASLSICLPPPPSPSP